MENQKLAERLPVKINIAIVLLLALLPVIAQSDYEEQKLNSRQSCLKIEEDEYQSGLIMNPDGYRSFYKRSACIQRHAVRFRDQDMCSEVRRRWALFSSSWGYSESTCTDLVNEGISNDIKALADLRRQYEAGAIRLTDFHIEKNGNGRDYDFVPSFSGGGFQHGYQLRFEIVDSGRRYLLTESGFHLTGNNRIRMFERLTDMGQRVPGFNPGKSYTVEASLVLSVGNGFVGEYWSPAFIEREFPLAERTQRLQKSAMF